MLNKSTNKSLLIIDEFGRGTNRFDKFSFRNQFNKIFCFVVKMDYLYWLL